MHRFALAAFALLATTSVPKLTGACSPADTDAGEWALDAAYATDAIPPGAVTATVDVHRPSDPDGGCGASSSRSTCGSLPARITLELSATDDASGTDVGDRFVVVGGQPPEGFAIGWSDHPAGSAVRPLPYFDRFEIAMLFDPDAREFAFDLEIRAVDKNGNEGVPTVIRVDG